MIALPLADGPTVVGLDLSLTATGVAVAGSGIGTRTLSTSAPTTPRHARTGKPLPPTLDQRATRLAKIVNALRGIVDDVDAVLVAVEGPTPNQTTGSHHDRSGLWWLLVDRLLEDGWPVVEIGPASLKKYATGKGNSGKDAVMLAAQRRWPDVELGDNNQADALVLAAMGRRHLGAPIDDLPKVNVEALDKITWPATSRGLQDVKVAGGIL